MDKISKPLLSVTSLYKRYNKKHAEPIEALKNISFDIYNHTHTVISGESGSGKTTLLSIISGLDSCESGCISIDGVEISKLSEQECAVFRLSRIGFVFQHHYLLQDFTALGNVMLPLLMNGYSKKQAQEKARHMLCRVGLENRTDHRPARLSGGECQRVAIARAVVHSPCLILADEPTGSLDTRNSTHIQSMLSTLIHEENATLIVATHDSSFLSIAHSHIHLKDGAVQFQKKT